MATSDISSHPRSFVQYDLVPDDTKEPNDNKEPLSRASTDTPLTANQRRQSLSFRLLAPTIAVFMGTAGLAILLIVWLVTHKVQGSLGDVYREGAFLLDEGTKEDGGRETGRLATLTITSAASTVIGLFTPVFMALYAYRTASAWVEAKESKLPTPLQYGLLLDALSGAGIMPLANISLYLFKARNGRSVPPMLIEAFAVATVAYVLVHAVSAVDLWLHSVTSNVLDTTERPMSPGNYSFVGKCPPNPAFGACGWSSGGWLGNRTLTMLVNANKTDEYRGITLADEGGFGVIVDPTVPQDVAFEASSYGARATCESLNARCGLSATNEGNITCPGFPSSDTTTFPLSNDTGLNSLITGGFNAADASIYLLSSTCVDCEHRAPPDVTVGSIRSPENATTSTYNLWLQIVWTSAGEALHYTLPGENNTALSVYMDTAMLLANCSLTYYNVTLGYHNGSYTLQDEVITPVGMSDGMSSPLRLGVFAANLVTDIEGPVFSLPTTDDAMHALESSLARFAAASAVTSLKADRLPAQNQVVLAPRILGRYPLGPVVTLLVLLFLYACFALAVCAATALVRTKMLYGRTSVLDLAVLRLSSHVALAAELFPPPDMDRAARSMRTEPLEMHDETEGAGVRVGLHHDDASGEVLFGMWREPNN